MLLETYTTYLKKDDLQLPTFLEIEREVTHEGLYSMYNLTKLAPTDGPSQSLVDSDKDHKDTILSFLSTPTKTHLTNGSC